VVDPVLYRGSHDDSIFRTGVIPPTMVPTNGPIPRRQGKGSRQIADPLGWIFENRNLVHRAVIHKTPG